MKYGGGKGKWTQTHDKILLIDNGAYDIKYSTAGSHAENKTLQNCKFTEKTFNHENTYFVDNIGSMDPNKLSNIKKNYQRSLSRGLLFDIDTQIEVWENIISKTYNKDKFDASESMLMFTHPPLIPENNLEYYLQIIFEYFGFDATFKSIPHIFSAAYSKSKIPEINQDLQLVVESGFSSTTIVPIFKGKPILNSIRRVDIGGKLLTNYLKESLNNLIDLDLRKDFYLVNLMKEEICSTSLNFKRDITDARHHTDGGRFILPEYRDKSEEALLKLPKEKYLIELKGLKHIIPELIFSPNIIGLEEGGIHEGIYQSVNSCHSDYKNLLLENIILTGKSTLFKNFKERLTHELEQQFDVDSKLNIYDTARNQTFNVLDGMKLFCKNKERLEDVAIYKNEYEELGPSILWKTSY